MGLEDHTYQDGVVSEADVAEYDKLQNQLHRVEHCGARFNCRKLDNGGYKWKPEFCDLFHLCSDCLQRRVEKLQKRLALICQENKLYMAQDLTPTLWRSMRKYAPGKENYACYPQANGTQTVFINAELYERIKRTRYGKFVTPVTPPMFTNLHWQDIVMTPEGERSSGKLGVEIKPVKPSFGDIIERQANITEANGVSILAAINNEINTEVILATSNLNPKTVAELQIAVDIRTDLLIELATARGYKVEIRRKVVKLTINPNSIDWLELPGLIVGSRKRKVECEAAYKRKIELASL